MKKLLPVIISIVIVAYLAIMSSCRKQADGPLPPPMPPTPTATPAPYLFYDFEESIDGWAKGGDPGITGGTYVPASSVPGGSVFSGNFCAQITCSFPASAADGEFEVSPSPSNFTGRTITAHILIPSGMPPGYLIQLYVFNDGYANFDNSTAQTVSSMTVNTWNTLTFPLSSLSNIDNVPKLGIQIIDDGATAWSGNIYLDDVVVN